MTVNSTTSAVTYAGTGATNTFNYTWQIAQAADLVVWTWTPASGSPVKLALTTDYTVSGATTPTGGDVTLVAGNLPVGTSIFIGSDPLEIQSLLLQEGAAFNPADVMNALDLLTREVQATRRIANNALQIPVVESLVGLNTTTPIATQRAGLALGFDASGNLITGGSIANITVSAAMIPVVESTTLLAAIAAMGPWGSALATATGGNTAISLANHFGRALYVADFGATGNGTTDDTAAIQAAINYAASIKGATIYFQPGTYKITSTLTVTQSNVILQGSGGNRPNDGGTGAPDTTLLQWAGSTGTVVAFSTPSGTGNAIKNGMGMADFVVDGNSTATTGVSFTSIRAGTFARILARNVTGQSFLLSANAAGTYAEASDLQYCSFSQLSWRNIDSVAVQQAHGIVLTTPTPGSNGANPSFNTFDICTGQTWGGASTGGNGFRLLDCDNNTFRTCSVIRAAGSLSTALFINGADANHFWDFSAGGTGGIVIQGTASGSYDNPQRNTFQSMDDGNGTLYPTIDAGCSCYWMFSQGQLVKQAIAQGVSAQNVPDALAQKLLLTDESHRFSNYSENHTIWNDDASPTPNEWGVALDGNGNFSFLWMQGTGGGMSLRLRSIGSGFAVAEGANGRQGVVTLAAGTATVAMSTLPANARIMLSRSTLGGTPGHLSSSIVVNTSFTITSSSAADTSAINYEIFLPG